MTSADEYARRILACTNEESLNNQIKVTFDTLLEEILESSRKRKIQSNQDLKATILKQNEKWAAICHIVNEKEQILHEDGFMLLLKKALPMTEVLLNQD